MAKIDVKRTAIQVTITLNEEEASKLRALTGDISSVGGISPLPDIYNALESAGVPRRYRLNTSLRGSKLSPPFLVLNPDKEDY